MHGGFEKTRVDFVRRDRGVFASEKLDVEFKELGFDLSRIEALRKKGQGQNGPKSSRANL